MNKLPSLQSFIDKTAIKSWLWYHFLSFYCVIPLIVLTIPLLPFNDLFILDICHPTFLSIYTSNFVHTTLPHLAGNLVMYLIAITGILFLENDKLRFRNMLAFLFVILPIIASIFFIIYLGKVCTVQEFTNTYGFSTITLGFTGYFVYLTLLSSIPLIFKDIEEGMIKQIYVFSVIVLINFVIFCMIDVFGIVEGMFLLGEKSLSNGFVHSIGFMSGIILPMIIELKKEQKIDNFHMTVLLHLEALIFFLTLYLSLWYLYL